MTTLLDMAAWPAPGIRVEQHQLAQGEHGRIIVTLDVPEGCHVQSNAPEEPFLIATSLEMQASPGLAFGPPAYPAGETERFEWSPVVLNVYRGMVRIEVPVQVAADANTGSRTISGRIRYQGCTENACFPPTDVDLSVDLEVVTTPQLG